MLQVCRISLRGDMVTKGSDYLRKQFIFSSFNIISTSCDWDMLSPFHLRWSINTSPDPWTCPSKCSRRCSEISSKYVYVPLDRIVNGSIKGSHLYKIKLIDIHAITMDDLTNTRLSQLDTTMCDPNTRDGDCVGYERIGQTHWLVRVRLASSTNLTFYGPVIWNNETTGIPNLMHVCSFRQENWRHNHIERYQPMGLNANLILHLIR